MCTASPGAIAFLLQSHRRRHVSQRARFRVVRNVRYRFASDSNHTLERRAVNAFVSRALHGHLITRFLLTRVADTGNNRNGLNADAVQQRQQPFFIFFFIFHKRMK